MGDREKIWLLVSLMLILIGNICFAQKNENNFDSSSVTEFNRKWEKYINRKDALPPKLILSEYVDGFEKNHLEGLIVKLNNIEIKQKYTNIRKAISQNDIISVSVYLGKDRLSIDSIPLYFYKNGGRMIIGIIQDYDKVSNKFKNGGYSVLDEASLSEILYDIPDAEYKDNCNPPPCSLLYIVLKSNRSIIIYRSFKFR